jgi:uncharacterized membrane protein
LLRALSLGCKLYLGLVIFSLVGSLFSHLTKQDPGFIKDAASVLTLGLGVAVVARPFVQKSGWWPTLAILLLGTGAELVGMLTGWPFGHYVYSDRWWPTVPLGAGGHFPLALPFAWLLVVLASFALAMRFSREWKPWTPILAGLIAALVDLPMEPVMTRVLGYWRWNESGPLPGGAPISNLIGWWVLTMIGGFILSAFRRNDWERPVEPIVVLVGHLALTFGIAGIAAL